MSSNQDARMYDDEVCDRIDEAHERIREARSSSGPAREKKLKEAQEELRVAKKTLHTLKVEIRSIPGPQKASWEKKTKDHLKRLTEAQGEIQELQREAAEAEAVYMSPDGDEDPSRQEARGIAKKIEGHQKGALSSLARTEATLERTEETAQDTAETLRKQGDQLRRIDEDLDALGTDVQRARKELNAFMRRMATDKLILCCVCLLVVGILVAIILHFVLPSEETGNNDGTPAPTPKK
eukprot:TRINITY_DN7592_c1_g1_i1.p1 TRINITY_DN7592_c1_g1~~TRINITY_DN7592_c1_g1_i1.p1  ORF type:complete len:271 (+),score=119.29 TRINITY_DN7592_c1_g1_i1:100-813(+)